MRHAIGRSRALPLWGPQSRAATCEGSQRRNFFDRSHALCSTLLSVRQSASVSASASASVSLGSVRACSRRGRSGSGSGSQSKGQTRIRSDRIGSRSLRGAPLDGQPSVGAPSCGQKRLAIGQVSRVAPKLPTCSNSPLPIAYERAELASGCSWRAARRQQLERANKRPELNSRHSTVGAVGAVGAVRAVNSQQSRRVNSQKSQQSRLGKTVERARAHPNWRQLEAKAAARTSQASGGRSRLEWLWLASQAWQASATRPKQARQARQLGYKLARRAARVRACGELGERNSTPTRVIENRRVAYRRASTSTSRLVDSSGALELLPIRLAIRLAIRLPLPPPTVRICSSSARRLLGSRERLGIQLRAVCGRRASQVCGRPSRLLGCSARRALRSLQPRARFEPASGGGSRAEPSRAA